MALSIVGGAGNSFYDLSSLTPAQAAAGSFEGGHSTAGNNEAAFNNAVFLANVPINIHNIQILDDVSAIIPIIVPGFPPLVDNGEAQGGFIDLFNWTHGRHGALGAAQHGLCADSGGRSARLRRSPIWVALDSRAVHRESPH